MCTQDVSKCGFIFTLFFDVFLNITFHTFSHLKKTCFVDIILIPVLITIPYLHVSVGNKKIVSTAVIIS